MKQRLLVLVLILVALASMGISSCTETAVLAPSAGTLYRAGLIDVEIELPIAAVPSTFVALMDDGSTISNITGSLTIAGRIASGQVFVPATGEYVINTVVEKTNGVVSATSRTFQAVLANNAENCENLNLESCLLPYPADRFMTRT